MSYEFSGEIIAVQPSADVPVSEEFALIWFESTQEWVVAFPSGIILRDKFRAMGYAHEAALKHLQRGECEFEVTEDTGMFYRFEKDPDFWVNKSSDTTDGYREEG